MPGKGPTGGIRASLRVDYRPAMTPRKNTRQRLIEAADALIEERGAHRLRLRDVASAVGIQEPSIYKFFANKDALVVATSVVRFQRGLLDLANVFAASVSAAPDKAAFHDVVRRILAATTTEERTQFRSRRFNVLGMAQARPELAEQLVEAQHEANVALGEALTIAGERGWIRTDVDTTVLAGWLIALINARVLLELNPAQPHAETWDQLTVAAVLHTLEG